MKKTSEAVRLACLVMGGALLAQQPPAMEDPLLKELEDILNTPVSLASKMSQRVELAPSITSVVTRSDIETFGARDLADVLQLIPGFQFGLDISNLVGVGFRGVFVHEGKVLIMIDGMTVNDLGFGNFSFFQSVPASMIQKVEVIRGPGSALYGGFAEMAVINVVTRRAGDLGGRAALSVGTLKGATPFAGGLDMAAPMAVALGSEASLAVSLGLMNGPTSTRHYVDNFGHGVDLDPANANRQWEHALVDARFGQVQVTYLHFKSSRMGQTGFDVLEPPNAYGRNLERNHMRYDGLRGVASFQPTEALKVEVVGEYASGTPVNTAQYSAALRGNRQGPGADLNRNRAEVAGAYTFTKESSLAFGVGYNQDNGRNVLKDGSPGLHADATGVMVYDRKEDGKYGYLQYTNQFDKFGVTLGGRYEDTTFGKASAPRVGLTYLDGPFNAKVLVGKAFRIPTTWQAYRFENPAPLTPEKATSVEVELGYRFNPNVILKGNAFRVKIENPLVSLVNFNYYKNSGNVVTTGFEGELQARYARWGLFSNVSFNKPTSDTSSIFLNQSQDQFLGFSRLKVVAGGYTMLGPVMVAPTVVHQSARSRQSDASAQDQLAKLNQGSGDFLLATSEVSAGTTLNLSLTWKDVRPGLDLRLLMHNLGDHESKVVQPFYGAQAPVPVDDRRVTAELLWRF